MSNCHLKLEISLNLSSCILLKDNFFLLNVWGKHLDVILDPFLSLAPQIQIVIKSWPLCQTKPKNSALLPCLFTFTLLPTILLPGLI